MGNKEMIKRIGNKIYIKGIKRHLISIMYDVDINDFRIRDFKLSFNSTSFSSNYIPVLIEATNVARDYINELKCNTLKTSQEYNILWEKEKVNHDNIKWLEQNVWSMNIL